LGESIFYNELSKSLKQQGSQSLVPLSGHDYIQSPKSGRSSPFVDFVTLPQDVSDDEDQARPNSPFSIAKIFKIHRPRPENQYFHIRRSQNSSPSPFGGSAHDVTKWLPVESSQRNAELLYYCEQFLKPFQRERRTLTD